MVMIKGLIFSLVTPNPLIAPTNIPHTKTKMTPPPELIDRLTEASVVDNAKMAPTERSIPAPNNTTVWPALTANKGTARNKIFESLGKSFPVQTADSLQEAVQRCFEMAFPGETVLLSPGCASFDMFSDFEHRGRIFKEAVAGLKNGRRNETINS